MLGLYLHTLTLGHKVYSILTKLTVLTLQTEL